MKKLLRNKGHPCIVSVFALVVFALIGMTGALAAPGTVAADQNQSVITQANTIAMTNDNTINIAINRASSTVSADVIGLNPSMPDATSLTSNTGQLSGVANDRTVMRRLGHDNNLGFYTHVLFYGPQGVG